MVARASFCGTMGRAISRHLRKLGRRLPGSAWAPPAISMGTGGWIWAYIDEAKQATYVIYNRGRRQFGEPEKLPGPPRLPYALAVADLNRDGRPDIVASPGLPTRPRRWRAWPTGCMST